MGVHGGRRRGWVLLRGLGAGLVLAVLLAGVPAGLWVMTGTPVPEQLPSLDQVRDALLRPDLDGSLFLTALTYVAWAGWATFAVSVLMAIPAAVRGRPPIRVPGLRLQQRAATGLVAMVVVAVGVGPSMANAGSVAAAATAGSPVVAAAGPATDDTSQDEEPEGAGAAAETTPAAAAAGGYTVRRGDSLWRIAGQQLGDPAMWPELAEANYGVRQPGSRGGLDRTHVIQPGWVLTLPAITDDADDGPAAGGHVVERGDNLWNITAADLGPDATADEIAAEWPRWWHTNRDIIGDDPDLIHPGQVLTHPDSSPAGQPDSDSESVGGDDEVNTEEPATAPAGEASSPASGAEAAGGGEHVEEEAPAGDLGESTAEQEHPSEAIIGGQQPPAADPEPAQPALPEVEADTEAAADLGDDQTAGGLPVRTTAGIGGLLAAGLIAGIALRRRRQHSKRLAGQVIATPGGDTADAEQAIRNVADPIGVDIIDRALRALGAEAAKTGNPLPAVRAARLTSEAFELYLDEPAALPAPWQGAEDGTVWMVPTDLDTTTLLDTEEVNATRSPYPGLVTIGHDTEGGHVLVDLEYLGAVNIDGDPDHAHQVMTALAIELGTSRWADDLSVAVVGACAELEQLLGEGRLRHVDDVDELIEILEAHATSDRAALTEAGVSSATHARAVGEWNPEIALIAAPLTPSQHDRLSDLIHGQPQVAIAAVTTGVEPLTEWVLRLAPLGLGESLLEPIGLPVEPQQVGPADYAAILDALRTTKAPGHTPEHTGTPKDVADEGVPVDGLDPAVARADVEPWQARLATNTTATPGHQFADMPPTDTDAAAAGSNGSGHPQTARPPDGDAPLQEPSGGRVLHLVGQASITDDGLFHADLRQDGPQVRVLGPVRIDGARGRQADRSHIGQLTEIATYIALHPTTGSEDLDAAIWPGEPKKHRSRTQACSRLRNWLGDDDTGQRYFPQMTDGHYRFADTVRTDWGLFRELAGDDPESMATEQLESALALVTGQPFTGATGRRPKYRWADRLKSEMITAVTDVAVTVAERALEAGQPRRARAAAATGLQVEPGMEQLWRYLLQAERQAGNVDGLRSAVTKLELLLDELGLDPEPETVALLDEVLPKAGSRHRAVAI